MQERGVLSWVLPGAACKPVSVQRGHAVPERELLWRGLCRQRQRGRDLVHRQLCVCLAGWLRRGTLWERSERSHVHSECALPLGGVLPRGVHRTARRPRHVHLARALHQPQLLRRHVRRRPGGRVGVRSGVRVQVGRRVRGADVRQERRQRRLHCGLPLPRHPHVLHGAVRGAGARRVAVLAELHMREPQLLRGAVHVAGGGRLPLRRLLRLL
mmetsp:Transcript_45394/g.69489  ORF Transcript_45394/g.69489 Transcript_45394/m.69489 type:complete len:213 (+) Transcript_45394:1101-1739(+)